MNWDMKGQTCLQWGLSSNAANALDISVSYPQFWHRWNDAMVVASATPVTRSPMRPATNDCEIS
jgi:hypothetical protein